MLVDHQENMHTEFDKKEGYSGGKACKCKCCRDCRCACSEGCCSRCCERAPCQAVITVCICCCFNSNTHPF